MKTNVAIHGTVAAPTLDTSRADDPKQNRLLQWRRREAKARPALIMIWRTNATSGRLECRWSLEPSAQTDEGVSCSRHFLHQAA